MVHPNTWHLRLSSAKGTIFGATGAAATTIDFHNVTGAAAGNVNTGLTDVAANTELTVVVHATDLTNHAALETFMDTTLDGVITAGTSDTAIVVAGIDTIDAAVGSEQALIIYEPDVGTNGDHFVLGTLGAVDLTTLTAANFAIV